jgi:RNA-splicing ligase RtcB
VFTDNVEAEAIGQIEQLLNMPFVQGSKIRIMPDVHAGAACVIGTTMTITDKVVPNIVGVDIGCGMETARIKEKRLELNQLDRFIHERIPCGFNIRKSPHSFYEQTRLNELHCFKHINEHKASLSLGTLGGGNHFIEVAKDSDGNIYIVIHSGSRHLGLEVAKYYQDEGYKRLNKPPAEDLQELIERLKSEGRHKEIQKEMRRYEKSKQTDIPRVLAYVEGDLFDSYIHDMKIIQEYAELNRKAMMHEITKGLKLHIEEEFTTTHNYIDVDSKPMILRKGAVSAREGEKLLIPLNMRDGSLICVGKGNPDWNYSAPHGAGRLMSRTAAKQSFTVSEFKKQMDGIFSSTIGAGTLDEAPMAYKSADSIVGNIGETVDIVAAIKPIYNFKAAD